MVFITTAASVRCKQMSLDDILFGCATDPAPYSDHSSTSTLTRRFDKVPAEIAKKIDVQRLLSSIRSFNGRFDTLEKVSDKQKLYHSFQIPKKTGGYRKIDAPLPPLMDALRELKRIFETDFYALYHTSAFAYIPRRSTVDAIKRHQQNESRWFAKFDFHDFFGSTTKEFLTQQLSILYPFSEVFSDPEGRVSMEKALDLCFLNGGLPQGTPISPLLTNLMMIPIDHDLTSALRNFQKNSFVYTRYADDIDVSSKYDFKWIEVQNLILETLRKYQAPFSLNTKKTRYGSSSGRNWNLGLMLNKDNDITVGYRKKKILKATIANYALDTKNGKRWPPDRVYALAGQISYYLMIERATISGIITNYNKKFSVDLFRQMAMDVSPKFAKT